MFVYDMKRVMKDNRKGWINMNKKLAMWVIGGIVTASAMGLGFHATVSAAEKQAVSTAMHGNMVMQDENKMGTMDHNAMGDMMKSGDMQKHCMEMMSSPEMQAKMQEMMKTPEMLSMMKEMMKTPEMQSMMKEVMQENK